MKKERGDTLRAPSLFILLHQLRHHVGVCAGIFERQSRNEVRLLVEDLGVERRLVAVARHRRGHRLDRRVCDVQLEDPLRLDWLGHFKVLEILLHLEAEALARRQADRMGLQAVRNSGFLDLVAERFLDELHQLRALAVVLVLLFVAKLKVAVDDGTEGLFVVVHQGLQGEFVRLAREIEDLVVLVLQKLGLRQLIHRRDALAGGIVDALLIFFHALDVLFQRRELLLRGGVEHQQLLERVLARLAAVAHDAEAELAAEVRVELLVALTVVLQELFKVGAHLLFKVLADDLELGVKQELDAQQVREAEAIKSAAARG